MEPVVATTTTPTGVVIVTEASRPDVLSARVRALLVRDEHALLLAADACRRAEPIDDVDLLLACGEVALKTGELAVARRLFREATALAPRNASAHLLLGDLALRTRDYEVARRAFERVTSIAPENYESAIGLANAHRHLRNVERAEAEYRRAIGIDDGRGEAYYFLGVLYHDYMDYSIAQRIQARQFYEQFAQRACRDGLGGPACDEVLRRCPAVARSRRRHRQRCRPGRLILVVQDDGFREGAWMQAEAARMQAEMARQEREGGGEAQPE